MDSSQEKKIIPTAENARAILSQMRADTCGVLTKIAEDLRQTLAAGVSKKAVFKRLKEAGYDITFEQLNSALGAQKNPSAQADRKPVPTVEEARKKLHELEAESGGLLEKISEDVKRVFAAGVPKKVIFQRLKDIGCDVSMSQINSVLGVKKSRPKKQKAGDENQQKQQAQEAPKITPQNTPTQTQQKPASVSQQKPQVTAQQKPAAR